MGTEHTRWILILLVITGLTVSHATPGVIEIRDWSDLHAIRNNLSATYVLMNDLDSSTPDYEELAGANWQPIGDYENPFTGIFDGKGRVINGLCIDRPYEDYVGLFGVSGGTIKNVGLANVSITGAMKVGGLVGIIQNGIVSNSYSTGNVSGKKDVGGLVGANDKRATIKDVGGLVGSNEERATISNSYSTGKVSGDYRIGGLVGRNYKGTVSNSHSTCDVNGDEIVGGLVGWNYKNKWYCKGIVSNSYSTGNVSGKKDVGGLVGSNEERATIINSYSAGNVSGDYRIGGLVGRNIQGSTVSNSYSTCNVNGETFGGLVGWIYGFVKDSFWEVDGAKIKEGDVRAGKTTAEMQNINTFREAGWDITAVSSGDGDNTHTWNIIDGKGYPFLSQKESGGTNWLFISICAAMVLGIAFFIFKRKRKRATWIGN